ncbi:MAG: ABC transporter ATP-binding protein [Blautia sp.]
MIKKLLRSVRDCKCASIKTAMFAGLEVVMEIIIPLLMAEMIDQGIYGGDMGILTEYGLYMIICIAFGLIFGLLAGNMAADASAGFARNLRQDLYFHIQEFSFTNIDKFSTAGLVTRLTTDVTNVQNAYQMLIRVAVRAPLMLLFSLLMSFAINVKLALIFLVMVPILGGGLLWLIHKAHPIFEKVFQVYDNLNGVVQENLSGIRVVKSFVREDYEKNKFQKVSTDVFQKFCKAETYMTLNTPLMQFVVYLCMILVFWFGARMIVLSRGTELTTGELTSLITYAMQILTSLIMLSMVLVIITIAQSSGERIVETLDEQSDMENPKTPVTAVTDGSICFNHVDFSYYKDETALCLRDINLSIPSGSTVGIIGSTGTGKSSLVSLIPRLYDTTSGHVLVGGVDVRNYDIETLRNSVAMVLQKNLLFSGTIKDNLRWGDENASDDTLIHACELAQADEFISGFPDGYDTYIDQGGTNVSGGQKQRLCIARALLKKPKILILDDSTSAVDTKTDALIRRAFRQEIPDTTKIIIAQRISSVEEADMIIVMDEDHIDAVGSHKELLRNNRIYQEIFASQQKESKDENSAQTESSKTIEKGGKTKWASIVTEP